MANGDIQDSLPRIILRIPGAWQGPEELAGRLPPGYGLEGDVFLMPAGRPLSFEAMPADGQFPSIFLGACHRDPQRKEVAGVNRYTMNAAVVGPGGSLAAAGRLLEAGAAVIRAGGFGVFIDNSALAHGGSDWLELAENRDNPQAVFYAFINLVKSSDHLASYGMHVLGQRDAIVAHAGNVAAALRPLEDFLRMVCEDQPEFGEGDFFADQQGSRFRLHGEPHERMPDHPVNNPYGRWRLEPVP